MTDEEQSRLEALRADISSRLASVCADWPLEMFDEMVRGLAALTLKYEHHAAASYDRRASERLVEDMKALVERSAGLRNSQPMEKLPESDP